MPFRYDIGVSSGRTNEKGGIDLGAGTDGNPYRINSKSLMFHTLITGRTGTGKSNLLLNISKNILQIEKSNLIVVDFHGSLSSSIISMIGKQSLIYLGASKNGRKSVKMNILKGASESSVSFYLTQEIFSRESSLSSGTWGPRLQTIFTSVLRESLQIDPESTLSDFMDTLLSREKMKTLAEQCKNESKKVVENLISRWQSWIEYSTSSINKLYPIISDPHVRSLVSSRAESLDIIRELKEGNKVVVLDVSKTRFSSTQGRIISSLVLNRIWTDILKEGAISPTMIIADEAQNLNSSVLSEILSEGRKFNAYVTVASQYLDQYDRYTKGALLSNCGSIYSFNVSEKDALDVSNVITNRKKRGETLKSILLGSPHNATHFDFLSANGIEVNSFTPYLIKATGSEENLENRIEESINRFGNEVQETQQEIELMPEHSYLLSFMLRFLENKGLFPEKEKKLNDLRPDIMFFHNNKPFVIEIEVSDLEKFSRAIEKAVNYNTMKLIFLCGRDKGKLLYEKFESKESVIKALENLQMKGIGSYFDFRKIIICEERGGMLYLIDKGKFTRFSLEKLDSYRTFRNKENIDEPFLEYLMNEMERKKMHILEQKELRGIGEIWGENCSLDMKENGLTLFDLYE
ncbi:MAG: DUF87 domain-containing protein [Candidatus Thermoplasmatota archaeon]|nr:DUF87 domain-containing protein [Candidatus Thermoplasmatota archaeon]